MAAGPEERGGLAEDPEMAEWGKNWVAKLPSWGRTTAAAALSNNVLSIVLDGAKKEVGLGEYAIDPHEMQLRDFPNLAETDERAAIQFEGLYRPPGSAYSLAGWLVIQLDKNALEVKKIDFIRTGGAYYEGDPWFPKSLRPESPENEEARFMVNRATYFSKEEMTLTTLFGETLAIPQPIADLFEDKVLPEKRFADDGCVVFIDDLAKVFEIETGELVKFFVWKADEIIAWHPWGYTIVGDDDKKRTIAAHIYGTKGVAKISVQPKNCPRRGVWAEPTYDPEERVFYCTWGGYGGKTLIAAKLQLPAGSFASGVASGQIDGWFVPSGSGWVVTPEE